MFDAILAQIRTKEELDELIAEVQILLNALYQNGGEAFDSLLKTKVLQKHSKVFVEVFSKDGIDKKTYLNGLNAKLNKIEFVSIKISFEPSDDFLDRLSYFVKKNSSLETVLDIAFDPATLGVAELIYKGNYRDYSFNKIFEQEFQKSRAEILKILEEKRAIKN